MSASIPKINLLLIFSYDKAFDWITKVAEMGILPFHHQVQTDSEARPASFQMAIGGFSPRGWPVC